MRKTTKKRDGTISSSVHNIRLVKLKEDIECFGGDKKRMKFWFNNLLGQFLIQPIIRFLLVLLFLRVEWFLLENAVGRNWDSPFGPFLAKISKRYSMYSTSTVTNKQLCACKEQKKKWQKNHPPKEHNMGPSTTS